MAIPKLKKQDVIDALKFIDENGVPEHNTSVKYVLVSEDGKKYPPKYVVAVADHLANSTDISTESFNSVDAKNYLKSLGFSIETKQQEKFELSITAESVESTDERFTMDNLSLGDNYKPLDAYFKRANGDVIKRAYSKGERRNSNQTLPRIACQVFEKQLAALSVEDKENFPVCKYNPGSDVIRGIYASVDDFKNRRNTIEYLTYGYDNGRQFVIYCWNIFSTIIFVQECLKRFGEPGDQFILTYREKDEKETAAAETEAAVQEELVQQFKGYRNPFSSMLIESKNLIFRGAPGTGKSYLAKEIAADIISNGYFDHLISLCEYIENLLIHIHDIIKEDDSYSGYYTDVEYNRNAGGIKTIRKTIRGQQEEIIPINCDLILHSRGENVDQDNLIAIEMKKSNAPSAEKQKDRERLIALTKDSFDDVWAWDHNLPEHVCRYVLGVYYEINYRQKEIHIEYYRRGELVRSYSKIRVITTNCFRNIRFPLNTRKMRTASAKRETGCSTIICKQIQEHSMAF